MFLTLRKDKRNPPPIYVLYVTVSSKSVAANCACEGELKLLRITLIHSTSRTHSLVFYLSYPFWTSKDSATDQVFIMWKVVAYFFPCPFWQKIIRSISLIHCVNEWSSAPQVDRRPAVCLQNWKHSP